MKRTPTKLERDRDQWKARALSAEAVIEEAATEIRESWKAQRALIDHQQRVAQRREWAR